MSRFVLALVATVCFCLPAQAALSPTEAVEAVNAHFGFASDCFPDMNDTSPSNGQQYDTGNPAQPQFAAQGKITLNWITADLCCNDIKLEITFTGTVVAGIGGGTVQRVVFRLYDEGTSTGGTASAPISHPGTAPGNVTSAGTSGTGVTIPCGECHKFTLQYQTQGPAGNSPWRDLSQFNPATATFSPIKVQICCDNTPCGD